MYMGELHTIASNGNLSVIKKALSKDKDAFLAIDEEMGWSPLHYAANKSKTKIVQAILEAGVDPNIQVSLLLSISKTLGI